MPATNPDADFRQVPPQFAGTERRERGLAAVLDDVVAGQLRPLAFRVRGEQPVVKRAPHAQCSRRATQKGQTRSRWHAWARQAEPRTKMPDGGQRSRVNRVASGRPAPDILSMPTCQASTDSIAPDRRSSDVAYPRRPGNSVRAAAVTPT